MSPPNTGSKYTCRHVAFRDLSYISTAVLRTTLVRAGGGEGERDGEREGSGPGKSRKTLRTATILLVIIVIVWFPDTPAQTDIETEVDTDT